MRRSVAAAAAVVLVLEALGFALVHWIMGIAVRHQQMSLAGLDPGAMAAGAWAAGVAMALFLIACAAVLVRMARRDRAPGRVGRIALLLCAVTHGVLGAALAAPVGWAAYAVMMVVLGFVVLTLVLYAGQTPQAVRRDAPDGSTPPPPVAPAAV
ncbi:hypothetical protein [Actinacidiphila sp. bgisy167]|uniref:hypothetical protein n=1 Tax=Actinacidiphila sp. bgisy167 TaxID=3413797 RepID=UPI003D7347B2